MMMSAVRKLALPMIADPVQHMADRDCAYVCLMAVARGGRNSHAIATMLASWRVCRNGMI